MVCCKNYTINYICKKGALIMLGCVLIMCLGVGGINWDFLFSKYCNKEMYFFLNFIWSWPIFIFFFFLEICEFCKMNLYSNIFWKIWEKLKYFEIIFFFNKISRKKLIQNHHHHLYFSLRF